MLAFFKRLYCKLIGHNFHAEESGLGKILGYSTCDRCGRVECTDTPVYGGIDRISRQDWYDVPPATEYEKQS